MKAIRFFTLGSLLVLFLLGHGAHLRPAGSATLHPWPMFHHDAQLTGRTPAIGPETPAIKWSYPAHLLCDDFGSVAIAADGTIYSGSSCHPYGGDCVDGHSVRALNPDGTLKWAFAGAGIFPFAPALADDGTIYMGSATQFTSEGGVLYALQPDGTLKWGRDMGAPISRSVIVDSEGTLYVPTLDVPAGVATMSAVNPDGTLKWAFGITDAAEVTCSHRGAWPCGTAVLGQDGTVYVVASTHLYALTPSGILKWRTEVAMAQGLRQAAVGSDGTVYVGVGGVVRAVDPDGFIKWSFDTSEVNITGAPAIATDGTIYVGTSGSNSPIFGYLIAVNPDGSLKWRLPSPTRDYLASSPLVDGAGQVYITDSHNLYAVRPDGTLKWQIEAGGGLPAPAMGADGTLYVYNGVVGVVAVGSAPTPSATPTATPTPPPAVGGIVELRRGPSAPSAEAADSPVVPYAALAGGAVAAFAVLGGAWYARRRRAG